MAETTTNSAAQDEQSLDSLRLKVLAACLEEAQFEGWTPKTLSLAATQVGADKLLPILFPKGVADLLTLWSWEMDEAMVAAFKAADPAPSRIRDKVRFLVKARIEALSDHREAARRAAATLALPIYGHLASRLTWATADAIWRALGDTSTDFNFYTKRTTLSAVWLSTLTRWFADDSEEAATPDAAAPDAATPYASTWAFLDDRIENVMQFEKVKAEFRKKGLTPERLIKPFAKLRYGWRN